MLISMTGFGRSYIDASFGRIVVELQSVNRKFLEIFISLPKELNRFELEIRKWVSEGISRGQLSVRIFLTLSEKALSASLPEPHVLKRLKEAWTLIAKEAGVETGEINLSFLLERLPISPSTELPFAEEEILSSLKECFKEAFRSLLAMKKQEGTALHQDIEARLDGLNELIVQVEQLSPATVAKLRDKLKERMLTVLEPGVELDERLLREVAFFAERVDISEEIARLYSHFEQFRGFLGAKEHQVGRKLEFLVQEIGREMNTIGSKALDSSISKLIVEGKGELEKVREQIQNIE